jgi:hypothetical protein
LSQKEGYLRQTGLVARLGHLEMPIQAMTFVAPTARLWYKPAVARGLSGSRGFQNVRYGYGPRIPRPSGAGVIGHHARNGQGR